MSAEGGGRTAMRNSSALPMCAMSWQSRSAFCPVSEPSYASRMRLYMDPLRLVVLAGILLQATEQDVDQVMAAAGLDAVLPQDRGELGLGQRPGIGAQEH